MSAAAIRKGGGTTASVLQFHEVRRRIWKYPVAERARRAICARRARGKEKHYLAANLLRGQDAGIPGPTGFWRVVLAVSGVGAADAANAPYAEADVHAFK